MKNLLVANWQPGERVTRGDLEQLLDAQLENSLALGWSPDDLLVVTNFPYRRGRVRRIADDLNTHCMRGSKMFALARLFETGAIAGDDVVWAHDLDAWQNHRFETPAFADLGLAEYSRPKFNGGSVFARPAAADMVDAIVRRIVTGREPREEPTINCVLRDPAYQSRVTVLNPTYNLGCSGFRERLGGSTKPVLVCHFHPTNRLAWDTHVNDRNGMGTVLAPRVVELLTRRFHGGIAPEKLPPKTVKAVGRAH
ncbi:MAG TPA: hypothetical protein VHV55_05960 [Pirellulales bacterium]|jgi:hypothetical protein|nr:hypothetical protein [Pirellulales bacterium]